MEVAKRSYTYDNLARRVTRVTMREGNVAVTDSFTYNGRGELSNATVNNGAYGYAYDTPTFGTSTPTGDVTQPIQWSSEYADTGLALPYYNYRHYNPTDGRWISRDPIGEQGGWNLYGFVGNGVYSIDHIGKRKVEGYYEASAFLSNSFYSFDVAFIRNNRDCELRFVALMKMKYEGSGNRERLITLFQEVSSLMQRNFDNLKVVLKDKNSKENRKCCCDNMNIYVIAMLSDEPLRDQLIPPIDNIQGRDIIFNPSASERSFSNMWLVDNPAVILHEILHLFGVPDEYLDSKYYPEKKKTDLPHDYESSIMGEGTYKPSDNFIKPRHLNKIIELSKVRTIELKDCVLYVENK